VSNISPNATEKTVSDFFSFCGKISKLYLKEEESRSAIVQFESESAAKTALLLTNALIVDRPITVVAFAVSGQPSTATNEGSSTLTAENQGTAVDQSQITQREFNVPDEQRTKTSVVASLLAAGYVLATDAIDKAKEYDDKHNISLRAKVAVEMVKVKANEIDQQYGISEKATTVKNAATDKAKKLNEEYHISEKAQQAASVAKAQAQKIQENPTVSSALGAIASTASKVSGSVSSVYQDYKEQTQKAIEEKKKQKDDQKRVPSESHYCKKWTRNRNKSTLNLLIQLPILPSPV